MYLTFASLLAELGVIPPARTISEVSLINRHPETQFPSEVSEVQIQFQPPAGSHYKEGCSISIGAATPPVPPKLVERIKTGDFIDMAELLPNRMGTSKSSMVDESTKQKVRRRPVSSIIEWVQCFNTYLSVMCRICPEKIPDLLAYQMLIVEASMVYEGNAWLGYDRRFRQAAAANPHMQWSKTDTDLWHLAFTGMIQRPRCVHCLSLTHKSPQCNWAQDTPEMPSSPKSGNWYYSPNIRAVVFADPGTEILVQAVHSRTASFSTSAPSVPGTQPAQTSHTRPCFVLTPVPEDLAQMLAAFLQVNVDH